ncbi:MAG: DNA polymerase III subunit gamma/tau [Acidobacteriota bacterium]|nr:DNA polymerase III subunit gamma/tau [Acidobacteriota bacterium]
MAYQVLARKWRPQQFADVIGQRGVTQTLRNAITQDRLAQAFVFAGPRGVGKTTTARVLARALNCVKGPTETPCGACDACLEIAEGRDIDVLEIDAATHTQVDNIREVIIAGLAIAPVRDRYKVFIIDEVHQLSASSFNALLKSIEEPPQHVVFIMATTLLDKIPDTIRSRSQVFEFRTIGTVAITEQLQAITSAEGVSIDEAGLALIARSADGSMRDAESALDQVIAFAGESVTSAEVSAVLGLVGRDSVLDIAETVAEESAARVFDLTGRFVEAGYDLRAVCRELSRLVRDLLVVKIDAGRITDPDIAADYERDRLKALTERFSREDLLRGFDVLAKAEFEIKGATQPRYHFEVAMLRWMHLRKLVPLTELLDGVVDKASPVKRISTDHQMASRLPETTPEERQAVIRRKKASPEGRSPVTTELGPVLADEEVPVDPTTDPKSVFLSELKRQKKFFYGTVAAQAQQIELEAGRVTFVFSEAQRTLSEQVGTSRSWLEALATQTLGRKMTVAVRKVPGAVLVDSPRTTGGVVTDQPPQPTKELPSPGTLSGQRSSEISSNDPPVARSSQEQSSSSSEGDLLSQALEDPAVQTMLDVFPADIKEVEEL